MNSIIHKRGILAAKPISAMNINDEKLALISWIVAQEKIDQLLQLKSFIDRLDSAEQDISKIVGQTPKGVRVSKQMLVEKLMISLKEIEKGNTISFDQLEKLSEKW